MSIFERFGVYVCRFGDLLVRDVKQVSFDTANSKSEPIPGGLVDRSEIITSFADPTISCTTCDFETILTGGTSIGLLDGYAVDSNAVSEPTATTLIQAQARQDGATFKGPAVADHMIYTNEKGFLMIQEIAAEIDSVDGARADLMYYALSEDGDTAPITPSLAALTSTPLYGGKWYLAPMMCATDSYFPGLQSLRVRPGINYQVKRADGFPYACIGSIVSRAPEVQLVTNDMSNAWSSFDYMISQFGRPVPNLSGSDTFDFYLEKGLHGGRRDANAAGTAIKISVETGDLTHESFSVADQGDGTFEITIRVVEETGITISYGENIPADAL